MKIKFCAGVIAILLSVSAIASEVNWKPEELEVIRFLESLPKAYATGDLGSYLDKYHEGYTNWYMTTDRVHNYAEIAEAVRRSQEAGYRILDFRVTPITIEIDDDRAFVRYVEEEKALDENGKEAWSKFHFAAILVRSEGRWKLWRTDFFRVPEEA
ncbi:MAG: YybH family protein [Woeseia sp.]